MAQLQDQPQQFAHLHLHSEYSLLDGGIRVNQLVQRVKELGMSAVAVTDHGNLYGAVEFYKAATKAHVKPIFGIEAYVAPSDRTNRQYTGVLDGGYHLVLLAENKTGWRNLLKLSSDAYLTGFYYKPRMDRTTLERWGKGLIAINGHMGSSIATHLERYIQSNDRAHYAAAVEEAKWHAATFGPNDDGEPRFFIELQRHGEPNQDKVNAELVRLARELDMPLVCDNDAHFLLEDDYDAHDTLCCISMGKLKVDENRLHYSRQLYVKSPEQMAELFTDLPDAVQNTARIAERCNVKLSFSKNHAPVVRIRKGRDAGLTEAEQVGSTKWYKAFCARYELSPFDSRHDETPAEEVKQQCDEALRQLAEAGAVWRYGEEGITDAIRARLNSELQILADKNISAYFLIVWDFVNEARRRGIPTNTRGSAVSTMVGYCLGISNACPVEYNLLFERFTDPDRSEYPDIDIDICQDGRQQIIEYVRQKYGHVAQIITFGTLKARAAIRDVGRVLDVPLSEVDKICKLVGGALGTTLDKALQQEPDLKKLYDDNPTHRQMIDTARRLEGMCRHSGVHAAGVVVATQPLENIVPVCKATGGAAGEQVVTQWDGPTVMKIGLLKMDFLGLRTLSTIEKARQLVQETLDTETIRQTAGVSDGPDDTDPLDLEHLRYDDQRVLDLFRRGETSGVFQFESGGMRNLLMAMKPDRIEDLIAANALYRPGPMDLIPDYNDRKNGRKPVPKLHPIVEKYTGTTYGVITYQEQVMQLMHDLGGVPLREAYTIIKAISKKDKRPFNASRPTFVAGAQVQGMAAAEAEELFEAMLKFAGYGFNKGHSTGYTIVAYLTAYLKTYFPVQYMAALLTYESVSTEKVVEYIDECRRVLLPCGERGVDVRPPDINRSDVGFTVVFDADEKRDADHGHVRFGLGAVKGVGEKAIQAIIDARKADAGEFTSLYDFCDRVPLGVVNRATVEALVKCGAFDQLHGFEKRAAMVEALDSAIAAGQSATADRNAGQMNFFGSFDEMSDDGDAGEGGREVKLPSAAVWSDRERLTHEKAVLGLYVSSHPLDEHREALRRFASISAAQIEQLSAGVPVIVGGMLTGVRQTVVRSGRSAGQKMAFVTIEDQTGPIDGVVFSDAYAIAGPLLDVDRIVYLKGKVDRRREEPSIVVDSVIPLERGAEELTQAVKIILREEQMSRNGTDGNGELNNLLVLLRRMMPDNGTAGANVFIEVHQAGMVVNMRINGTRIAVTADLPQRIATVLRIDENCCELIGPDKLMPQAEGKGLRHDPNSPRPGDLPFTSSGREAG